MERPPMSDLRKERQHYLELVRRAKEAFRRGSPELRNDFYAACTAVTLDSGSLRYASKELQGHRDLVLRAVVTNPSSLQYASPELRGDRDLLWQALGSKQSPLRHASSELRGDKALVLRAVRRNGYALKHASAQLQDDPDVVFEAAKSDGEALVYASRQLRGCKNIVVEAVANMGLALEYASDELRADRDVVLAATKNFGGALEYASDELQGCKDIVLEAVKNDVYAFNFASSNLHGDREVVLEVTKSDCEGLALLAATEEIRGDKDILLRSARQHQAVLSHYEEIAPQSLKNNLTVEGLRDAVNCYLAAPGEPAPVLTVKLSFEHFSSIANGDNLDQLEQLPFASESSSSNSNNSNNYNNSNNSNKNNNCSSNSASTYGCGRGICCDATLLSGEILTCRFLDEGSHSSPILPAAKRPRLHSDNIESDFSEGGIGGGGNSNGKGISNGNGNSSNRNNSIGKRSKDDRKESEGGLMEASFWQQSTTMNDLAKCMSELLQARAPEDHPQNRRVFIVLEDSPHRARKSSARTNHVKKRTDGFTSERDGLKTATDPLAQGLEAHPHHVSHLKTGSDDRSKSTSTSEAGQCKKAHDRPEQSSIIFPGQGFALGAHASSSSSSSFSSFEPPSALDVGGAKRMVLLQKAPHDMSEFEEVQDLGELRGGSEDTGKSDGSDFKNGGDCMGHSDDDAQEDSAVVGPISPFEWARPLSDFMI